MEFRELDLLNKSLDQSLPDSRLLWPEPPFPPINLRYQCSFCRQEFLELEPAPPSIFRDLIGLRGYCFSDKCQKTRLVNTLFATQSKAGQRHSLYEFKGDQAELVNCLVKCLPDCPRSSFSSEMNAEISLDFEKYSPNCEILPSKHALLDMDVRAEIFARLKTPGRLHFQLMEEQEIHKFPKQILPTPKEELRNTLSLCYVPDPTKTKEWFFASVIDSIFEQKYFENHGPNKTYYVCPNLNTQFRSDHYTGLGRIIGIAFLDCQFIKAYFSRALFKLLLGKPLHAFQDFQTIEKERFKLYRLYIDFDKDLVCQLKDQSLKPPEQIDILEAEYPNMSQPQRVLEKIKNLLLGNSVRAHIKPFVEGFYDVVPFNLVSHLSEFELELLLCGTPDIDVDDWRKHTQVKNFPLENDEPVSGNWFFEILKEFNVHQRAMIYQLATGTSKFPGSFEKLVPRFTIYRLETLRLPVGHTWNNELAFPLYRTKQELKDKLLEAIQW